jgi:hypothetical protein
MAQMGGQPTRLPAPRSGEGQVGQVSGRLAARQAGQPAGGWGRFSMRMVLRCSSHSAKGRVYNNSVVFSHNIRLT